MTALHGATRVPTVGRASNSPFAAAYAPPRGYAVTGHFNRNAASDFITSMALGSRRPVTISATEVCAIRPMQPQPFGHGLAGGLARCWEVIRP